VRRARISSAIKEKYPGIEWNNIVGFRNISIHEYFGVNFQIVWQIKQNDLPVLKLQFSKLLVGFGSNESGKAESSKSFMYLPTVEDISPPVDPDEII
jgi:hypothetical protein